MNGKTVVFSAGGTGGHINPALAVAGEIRRRSPDCNIVFIGTAVKMEARLVPAAGFELKTIKITGFKRELSLSGIKHNIRTLWYLLNSSRAVKKIFKEIKPDMVVGFGGYVSGPVVRTAAKMGIKTAIHEQNAFPGITNKALAKKVDAVMITSAEAEKYFEPKNPVTVTGLPIRKEILTADRDKCREEMNLGEKTLVLSMGGSLGAKSINEAMIKVISDLSSNENIVFLHATGKGGIDVKGELERSGVDTDRDNIIIREYIDDMDKVLAAADLVVCRAGASSICEFQAAGKPSILIPYPYAAENHQFFNAKVLADAGAAVLIEEKDLTPEKLRDEIAALTAEPEKLREMGKAASKDAITDATDRITVILEKLIG